MFYSYLSNEAMVVTQDQHTNRITTHTSTPQGTQKTQTNDSEMTRDEIFRQQTNTNHDYNGNAITRRERAANMICHNTEMRTPNRYNSIKDRPVIGYNSKPTKVKRQSLSQAEMHIQKMPVIYDDGKQMAVWTDIKEIIFPSCSESLCDIVLTVIKEILGYPRDETNASPCTPKQQMAFLRNFRIVPCGTLLVNTRVVQAKIAMLKNLVRTRHLTSEEIQSRECHYWKEHANHDNILSPDHKVCSEFQQMKMAANNHFCWCVLPLNEIKEKFKNKEPDPIIYNGRNLLPAMKLCSRPYVPMSLVYPYFHDVYSYLFDLSREHLLGNGGNITKCLTSLEANCLSSYIARQQGWGAKWRHITSRDLMIDWQLLCKHVKNPPTLTVENPDLSNNVAMVSPLQILYDTEQDQPHNISAVNVNRGSIQCNITDEIGQNVASPVNSNGQNMRSFQIHKGQNVGGKSNHEGQNVGCHPKGISLMSRLTSNSGEKYVKIQHVPFSKLPKNIPKILHVNETQNLNSGQIVSLLNNDTVMKNTQNSPRVSMLPTTTASTTPTVKQFKGIGLFIPQQQPAASSTPNTNTSNQHGTLIGYNEKGEKLLLIPEDRHAINCNIQLINKLPVTKESQVGGSDLLPKSQPSKTAQEFDEEAQFTVVGANETVYTETSPSETEHSELLSERDNMIGLEKVQIEKQSLNVAEEKDGSTAIKKLSFEVEGEEEEKGESKSSSSVKAKELSEKEADDTPFYKKNRKMPREYNNMEKTMEEINRGAVGEKDEEEQKDLELNKGQKKKKGRPPQGKSKNSTNKQMLVKVDNLIKKKDTDIKLGKKKNKDKNGSSERDKKNPEEEMIQLKTIDENVKLTENLKEGNEQVTSKFDIFTVDVARKSSLTKVKNDTEKTHNSKSKANTLLEGERSFMAEMPTEKSVVKKGKVSHRNIGHSGKQNIDSQSRYPFPSSKRPVILPVGKTTYERAKVKSRIVPSHNVDVVGSILDDSLASQKRLDKLTGSKTKTNSKQKDISREAPYREILFDSDERLDRSGYQLMKLASASPFAPDSTCAWRLLNLYDSKYVTQLKKNKNQRSSTASDQQHSQKTKNGKTSQTNLPVIAKSCEILPSQQKNNMKTEKARKSISSPLLAAEKAKYYVKCENLKLTFTKIKEKVTEDKISEVDNKDKENVNSASQLDSNHGDHGGLGKQGQIEYGKQRSISLSRTGKVAKAKTLTDLESKENEIGNSLSMSSKKKRGRKKHSKGKSDDYSRSVDYARTHHGERTLPLRNTKTVVKYRTKKHYRNENINDKNPEVDLDITQMQEWALQGSVFVLSDDIGEGNQSVLRRSMRSVFTPGKSRLPLPSETSDDDEYCDTICHKSTRKKTKIKRRRGKKKIELTRPLVLEKSSSEESLYDPKLGSSKNSSNIDVPQSNVSKSSLDSTSHSSVNFPNHSRNPHENSSQDTIISSSSQGSASVISVEGSVGNMVNGLKLGAGNQKLNKQKKKRGRKPKVKLLSADAENVTVDVKQVDRDWDVVKVNYEEKVVREQERILEIIKKRNSLQNHPKSQLPIINEASDPENLSGVLCKHNSDHVSESSSYAGIGDLQSFENSENFHQISSNTSVDENNNIDSSNSYGLMNSDVKFEKLETELTHNCDPQSTHQVNSTGSSTSQDQDVIYILHDDNIEHQLGLCEANDRGKSTGDRNFFDWAQVQFAIDPKSLTTEIKGNVYILTTCDPKLTSEANLVKVEGSKSFQNDRTSPPLFKQEILEETCSGDNSETDDTLVPQCVQSLEDIFEDDETLTPVKFLDMDESKNQNITDNKNLERNGTWKSRANEKVHVYAGKFNHRAKLNDNENKTTLNSARSVISGDSLTSNAVGVGSNTSNVTMSSTGSNILSNEGTSDLIGVDSFSSVKTLSDIGGSEVRTGTKTGKNGQPSSSHSTMSTSSTNSVFIETDAHGVRFMPDYDDTGQTYSGLIFEDDITVPYVLVNGYKYTVLRDVLPLFSTGCEPKCKLPKNVLRTHPVIPRTYCTWDQVFLLDQLICSIPRGPVITGEVLVRFDKLHTMMADIKQIIADKHQNTKLKNSQNCKYKAT